MEMAQRRTALAQPRRMAMTWRQRDPARSRPRRDPTRARRRRGPARAHLLAGLGAARLQRVGAARLQRAQARAGQSPGVRPPMWLEDPRGHDGVCLGSSFRPGSGGVCLGSSFSSVGPGYMGMSRGDGSKFKQWQVSGLPCKHALAFMTSLVNAHIQNFVDSYYSVDKFRASYGQLIPSMCDKTQWPESNHGFFMHPPLLKAVAGRPQTERHKGCSEKKRKSGQHLCPICKEYGHHWQKCKKGNKDDIVALMDVREPPKKRRKTTKSAESSIVPRGDEAPAAAMYFPPRQSLEITTKKKGKHSQTLETTKKKNGKGCKRSGKGKMIELAKKDGSCPMVPFDSPAMGTRSKKTNPAIPAMSTRSKRRLSL